MTNTRTFLAALAVALAATSPAAASTYFTGTVTRAAADLYEGTSGELIHTVSCAEVATARSAVVRIDASAGAVVGRITFDAGGSCDIEGIYAAYVSAPRGTYAAVLTRLDAGYYLDSTYVPNWIVRGANTCPAASSTPAYVSLAATGPTYVPPGTTLGTLTFNPGAGSQACGLVGIFGHVDFSMLAAYPLVVTRDGTGTGSVAAAAGAIDCGVACTASFGSGSTVTLSATPSPGSSFAGWSGACSGAGPCTVTMTAAADVTATFLVNAPSSYSLAVTRAGSGSGAVASTPGGIACGATCSANFPADVPVTLRATADAGSTFAGWSVAGCSGTTDCVVPMNAAANVTAFFDLDAPVTYALAVTRVGTGTGAVSSSPAGIDCGAVCSAGFASGQVVLLTAVASEGSVFAGWNGAGCSGTGTCAVTMSAARSVVAAFANAAPSTFALAVSKAGTGAGTVSSDDGGIGCGSACAASYASRTVVSLTATPEAGSTFTGWSGACTGTGACLVTMDAARAVTATFALSPRALAVTRSGTGGGTIASMPAGIDCGATCNASFEAGAVVALTATPATGSFFAGWSGACTGTGACSVTMGAARAVTATFKPDSALPRLANISTRMQVLTGNDVLIGGFIIGGSTPKTVVVRARGPSLVPFGITNALMNPTMQLFSGQTVLATSDDFGTAANLAALDASGFAPSDPRESAILTTLAPGAYTAVVSGAGGTTGVGIIEVFEVDHPETPLANISTRGQVLTGGDVMIGGFVIQGDSPQTVIVRARGPSLIPFGIANALQDPVLQLFSGQTVIASNDDWQASPDASSVTSRGFAPGDARESVILITLAPGAYTAIVSGKNGGTGVGIIEVFAQ